jgi:hypothetical protein
MYCSEGSKPLPTLYQWRRGSRSVSKIAKLRPNREVSSSHPWPVSLTQFRHEADIKARLTRIEDILSTLITRLPTAKEAHDAQSDSSHGTAHANTSSVNQNAHLHPQHANNHHHTQQGHGGFHQRPIAPAPPSAVSARNRMRSNGSRTPVPASAEDGSHGYQRVDVDVRAMLSGGAGEEVFHPKAHDSNSQVRQAKLLWKVSANSGTFSIRRHRLPPARRIRHPYLYITPVSMLRDRLRMAPHRHLELSLNIRD